MPDRLASEVEVAGSWASLLGAWWRLFALGNAPCYPCCWAFTCPGLSLHNFGVRSSVTSHPPPPPPHLNSDEARDSPDRLAQIRFSHPGTLASAAVAVVDAASLLSPGLLFVTDESVGRDRPINAVEKPGGGGQGPDGLLLACK